ncbi:MAG: hypothetical protein R3362_13450, partial [Rhodothermales bacterium]|nr:hypothetical protein [Rhodothermales bacterium]
VVFASGTDGVGAADFLTGGAYEALAGQAVQVILAPPGESLRAAGRTVTSRPLPAGLGAVYDYEVDVARALLRAVLNAEPRADAGRVAAVGFGRGATDALLLAERPTSSLYPFTVRAAAALAGFTDYTARPFREVLRNLLLDRPTVFPGGEALAEAVLDPLREGVLPLEDARLALLRRSPAYFTDALPPLFLRHSTSDAVVSSTHADLLLDRIDDLDRVDYEPVSGVSHEGLFARPEVQQALALFLERHLYDGA